MSNEGRTLYYRAARFPGEKKAGAVYFGIQKLIERPEAELSAYRFQLHGVWHVAVVGDAPGNDLAEKLEWWLSAGDPVDLPGEVLDFLQRRRAEQIQRGPWVEGHYRPGRRFRFGRE